MKITIDRAKEILARAAEKRILVVGDLMMDRFVYGSVSRISPEAPVPVVKVFREKSMPGGACNVAANLLSIGSGASIAGIVGEDAIGTELKALLAGSGVRVGAVVGNSRYPTCLKTRIVAERQQVVRVDREEYLNLFAVETAAFLELIEADMQHADGVIIEDYSKGTIQQEIVDEVLRTAAAKGIPVGYDPKDEHILKMEGVTVVTPNRKEAFGSAGIPEGEPDENPLEDSALLETGRILQEIWKARHTLITLGAKGMLLCHADAEPQHIPTRAREVFDVSGAGDTVIATYVLALAAGATFLEAAELSNFAAGIVVGKLGTATCTREELIDYMKSHAEEL
ncbi:MAG: D-glycero-beta-D-manno-heptose-7-phosphate kinase [Kiritimatiellales bacterium]|nr:D-glycero-beta-D-manno-heptose-7-phosphate kinase [Kiritimatiellales bacterium]